MDLDRNSPQCSLEHRPLWGRSPKGKKTTEKTEKVEKEEKRKEEEN